MGDNKISQKRDSHENKIVVSLEDDAANLAFKEWIDNQCNKITQEVSLEVLRKILVFGGIDYEKFHREIIDLLNSCDNDKQLTKGVNKMAKKIIIEIKTK